MSNVAIRVEYLGKMYRIGGPKEAYQTFRDAVSRVATAPLRRLRDLVRGQAASDLREEIWALKDASFEIKHGEVVGIIGRNGAGKSTLLKILSRITEPTKGHADIYGRVGALLEVGTGFHPELTGRENVYLNGAVLGMSRRDIERKFDEIVGFAGVEKFIDTPVKHYSSGMGLRLGFAVAAHLEPEILLIDEVLAVGDAQFQRMCLGKMSDVAQSGRTVLFVSHNMAAVASLCNRILWLDNGHVRMVGETTETIQMYLSSVQDQRQVDLVSRTDRGGSGEIRFTRIWLENSRGDIVDGAVVGQELTFMIEYATQPGQTLHNVQVSLVVRDSYEHRLFSCSTHFVRANYAQLTGTGVIACTLPSIPLAPGIYSIDLWISDIDTPRDYVLNAHRFHVIEGDFFGSGKLPNPSKHGLFLVNHSWRLVDFRQETTRKDSELAPDPILDQG